MAFGQILYAQIPPPVTENVTISARVGEEITVTPGGSSGSITIPKTAVSFSGFAYPGASVSLLKQGEEKTTVVADGTGYFTITLPEIYDSSVLYSLFAEDISGNRSLLINYPIAVQVGFLTHLSGIRFPPTIITDKTEVKFRDYLTVSGYALPQKEMEVVLEGKKSYTFTLVSSMDGPYKIILPMLELPKGDYVAYVKYPGDTRISKFVSFIIGELNIFNSDGVSNIPGDCNADRVINLVDFSVLAFWYGKNKPPSCVDTNHDSLINLIDFSILAFYWTG